MSLNEELFVSSFIIGLSTVVGIIYGWVRSKYYVTTKPVGPTTVDPTAPTPIDPVAPDDLVDPNDPTPDDPTPDDPTPDDPTPVDPTPVDPTPVDPTPVDPTPVDLTPVAPVTTDSAIITNITPTFDHVPELHLLLIEADDQYSLEGACLLDCFTVDKYLTNYLSQPSTKHTKGCTMLLSIDDSQTNRMKFTNKNIIFDKLSNYKTRFTDFTSKVAKNDTVLILISGHGYQQKSETKEEVDDLDEYICHDNGSILDNEINELLLNKLTGARRVICLADTCHSGTIFDNSNYNNIFSISACLDKQSAYNDVGVITGFGGALTVRLFDQPNACDTLITGNITDIKNLISKISKIIAPLRQTPLYIGPAILPI